MLRIDYCLFFFFFFFWVDGYNIESFSPSKSKTHPSDSTEWLLLEIQVSDLKSPVCVNYAAKVTDPERREGKERENE